MSSGHPSAGVGLAWDCDIVAGRVQHRTPAFSRAAGTGRVDKLQVIHSAHLADTAYSFYGYAGRHEDPERAKQTSLLLDAVLGEHEASGGGPAVIAGSRSPLFSGGSVVLGLW